MTGFAPRLPRRRRLVAGGLALAALTTVVLFGGQRLPLELWHTEELTEEFSVGWLEDDVSDFDTYLQLEDSLFRELDDKVYAETGTDAGQLLNRYSTGSTADPTRRRPNWNRSFELNADGTAGNILLLHGMSDSPYSLRAIGQSMVQRDYRVVGLRLPGHGTVPSGLKHATWRDMAAAVELVIDHLGASPREEPLHIIGYSTGASLALDYTLSALEDDTQPLPASLVLISPAIRVHPAAGLARFKNALSFLPGLGGWSWLSVMDEFDPYKYNSFATNAGAQVHDITRNVDRRIETLAADGMATRRMPPILALKSTVDSTVSTEAVVDNLLMRLPEGRNELVLFDINRHAAVQSTLLVSDPGPLTTRLLNEQNLPFSLTLVTNERPDSENVVARYKTSGVRGVATIEPLGLAWPRGVVSLSHVALPFPPDDPVYGRYPPSTGDTVFLGNLAIKGELGLLKLPPDWLLRLRHNPFYDFLEARVADWLSVH